MYTGKVCRVTGKRTAVRQAQGAGKVRRPCLNGLAVMMLAGLLCTGHSGGAESSDEEAGRAAAFSARASQHPQRSNAERPPVTKKKKKKRKGIKELSQREDAPRQLASQ